MHASPYYGVREVLIMIWFRHEKERRVWYRRIEIGKKEGKSFMHLHQLLVVVGLFCPGIFR